MQWYEKERQSERQNGWKASKINRLPHNWLIKAVVYDVAELVVGYGLAASKQASIRGRASEAGDGD